MSPGTRTTRPTLRGSGRHNVGTPTEGGNPAALSQAAIRTRRGCVAAVGRYHAAVAGFPRCIDHGDAVVAVSAGAGRPRFDLGPHRADHGPRSGRDAGLIWSAA